MRTILYALLVLTLCASATQVLWALKAQPTTVAKGTTPITTERIEQHVAIIQEQLELQRRMIEEARRP